MSEKDKKNIRVIKVDIKKKDELYNVCLKYSILAKNLYNFTNYKIRQVYLISKRIKEKKEIKEEMLKRYNEVLDEINKFNEETKTNKVLFQNKWYGDYIGGNGIKSSLNSMLKDKYDFIQMPSRTSSDIIGQVATMWKSYFKAMESYAKDKSKFSGLPKPPTYKKDKSVFVIDSESVIIKDNKLSFKKGKKGYRSYNEFNCKHNIKVPLPNWERNKYSDANLCYIRVVPKNNKFTLEFVYSIDVKPKNEINGRTIAIDIGVDRLATVCNNINEKPFAINGKPLKSANKYYNKISSKYKSELMKTNGRYTSNKYKKMCDKRNSIMDTYMHQSASYIIKWCEKYNIDTIVIGKNKNWKQKINIGNETQTFMQIPFAKFIDKIVYRAETLGINVVLQEESYTSKSSFIDSDAIPKYGVDDNDNKFSGRRVQRGLYKSKDGTKIHADLNGAYNILRKYDKTFTYNNNELHPYIVIPNKSL